MKSSLLIGLLATVLALTSCENDRIRASGEVTTQEFSFSGYDELKVGGAFEVFLRFSETEESVRIQANENLQDRLVVGVNANTLTIRPENNLSISGNATLRAFITTNNLSAIELSGASTLTLEDEWIVSNGNMQLSGASDLKGEVTAQSLVVRLSGASGVDLFGTTAFLNAQLTGSSDIGDFDLLVERLDIDLAGASEAFLSVSESIDISASGASVLNYKGNAAINRQQLSGSSEIRKYD